MKHPLICLTGLMDWELIEQYFAGYVTSGWGALTPRLATWLLYLQHVPDGHPKLALKDLGLAAEVAIGVGAAVPLGELARNLYALNSRAGRSGLDFSSVQRLFASLD